MLPQTHAPRGGGGASPRHVGACPLGLRGCCGASSPQAVGAPVAGAGGCVAASPRVVGGRVGWGGGGGCSYFGKACSYSLGAMSTHGPGHMGMRPSSCPRWFLLCVCLWGGGGGGLLSVLFFSVDLGLGGGGGPWRVSWPPWQNPARLLTGEPPPRNVPGVGTPGMSLGQRGAMGGLSPKSRFWGIGMRSWTRGTGWWCCMV